jgi:outer membrane lipoprotein-sorting protein
MKTVWTVIMMIAVMSLWISPVKAGETPSAEQVITKSQEAFYYQASDMKAKVEMALIDKKGKTRNRVLTMLRIDLPSEGDQKYFTYFHEPGDVRGMTFMVWKYTEKEDDRWLFVPAVDLIRRIAADDKRSSFVGSDFTYEDISGRDAASDTHTHLKEETLDDCVCYVIESTPKEVIDFTKRISWIDKKTFLPVKEEYYDRQNTLYRVFTAEKIEDVASEKDGTTYPSVTQRTMSNLKTGHKTEVSFTEISYDHGLKDGDFSERYMRKPPRNWIR